MNPHYLSPTTGPRISLSYTKAIQFSERGDPRNQLARGRCCPGKGRGEKPFKQPWVERVSVGK